MEIFNSLDEKIQQLEVAYHFAIDQSNALPDAAYHLFILEAEIRDIMFRKDRFSALPQRVECHLGNHPVKDINQIIKIGNEETFIICKECISLIQKMMGTTEFEKKHGLKNNSVNIDIREALQPLIEHNLIIKSGKVWIIHDSVYYLFYKKENKALALNSWIDTMKDQLHTLKAQKNIFDEIENAIPGAYTQMFALNAQIDDLKKKLSRITDDNLTYRCSECERWIRKTTPTFFGVYTICDDCKNVLSGVMGFRKCEEKFKLTPGTLKRDNSRGKLEKYKQYGLLRQSGSTWIIHEIAIMDLYGELPKHTFIEPYSDHNIPTSLLERSKSVFNKLKDREDNKS